MDEASAPWDSLLREVARADAVDPARLGPAPGAVLSGRYRVEEQLGAGGAGIVYGVTELTTGRRLALKWLHAHAQLEGRSVRRLRIEAEAAQRVRHGNLLRVFGLELHEETPYLTMERLEGETLAELLQREGPIAPRAALALVLPAVAGVAAAHRAGVLHRDLKPQNLFMAREQGTLVPKVLDFGLSKLTATLTLRSTLTGQGELLGTPQFMAPEQARDPRQADARSDVYALGAVLYHAVSGRLPHAGRGVALLRALSTREPEPLGRLCPQLEPAFVAIVSRAMAREPDARFADGCALARALQTLEG